MRYLFPKTQTTHHHAPILPCSMLPFSLGNRVVELFPSPYDLVSWQPLVCPLFSFILPRTHDTWPIEYAACNIYMFIHFLKNSVAGLAHFSRKTRSGRGCVCVAPSRLPSTLFFFDTFFMVPQRKIFDCLFLVLEAFFFFDPVFLT